MFFTFRICPPQTVIVIINNLFPATPSFFRCPTVQPFVLEIQPRTQQGDRSLLHHTRTKGKSNWKGLNSSVIDGVTIVNYWPASWRHRQKWNGNFYAIWNFKLGAPAPIRWRKFSVHFSPRCNPLLLLPPRPSRQRDPDPMHALNGAAKIGESAGNPLLKSSRLL